MENNRFEGISSLKSLFQKPFGDNKEDATYLEVLLNESVSNYVKEERELFRLSIIESNLLYFPDQNRWEVDNVVSTPNKKARNFEVYHFAYVINEKDGIVVGIADERKELKGELKLQ